MPDKMTNAEAWEAAALQLQKDLDESTAKYLKLQAAVAALYYHAWFTPDRGESEEATALWQNLRDAAGFPPGGATKHLGAKRDTMDLRTMAKRAMMILAYSADMWRDGGLDPAFFGGGRNLYSELAERMAAKPVLLLPHAGPTGINACLEELRIPRGRVTVVYEADALRGMPASTVLYDPYSLIASFAKWRERASAQRLDNVVSGKALVASVLAARLST